MSPSMRGVEESCSGDRSERTAGRYDHIMGVQESLCKEVMEELLSCHATRFLLPQCIVPLQHDVLRII